MRCSPQGPSGHAGLRGPLPPPSSSPWSLLHTAARMNLCCPSQVGPLQQFPNAYPDPQTPVPPGPAHPSNTVSSPAPATLVSFPPQGLCTCDVGCTKFPFPHLRGTESLTCLSLDERPPLIAWVIPFISLTAHLGDSSEPPPISSLTQCLIFILRTSGLFVLCGPGPAAGLIWCHWNERPAHVVGVPSLHTPSDGGLTTYPGSLCTFPCLC